MYVFSAAQDQPSIIRDRALTNPQWRCRCQL
jgi:hypothetical protein